MGSVSLSDIIITRLKMIDLSDGNVWHAMKQNDDGFLGFGEAYFSWVNYGAIKAWKRHKRMTMNLIVPVGTVRFVFKCTRTNQFRVEEIGTSRYARITIPPGIWFGFKGLENPNNLVLNITSISHDPNEIDRMDLAVIKYE